MNREKMRLIETKNKTKNWRQWGPYLTERQWGTVREDYSAEGEAWDSISHDQARSKAYRWGEEGIGGLSDDKQNLCLSLALWNGKDAILKERLFGLTGSQGNHGEDVKEYYYYLDSTPTHSYMKMLYKYPQEEFPYEKMIQENTSRGYSDPEFELEETGILKDDKYFDVFIEYAKEDSDDILLKISVHNRGTEEKELTVLPQIWFRDIWSWNSNMEKPLLKSQANNIITIKHSEIKNMNLFYEGRPEPLFCDNKTNSEKLYNIKNKAGYFKDGINDFIVNKNKASINPSKEGTKAGLAYKLKIKAKESSIIRLRLSQKKINKPFLDFTKIFMSRIKEADEFFNELQSEIPDEDSKKVQRQALAGMLWSKQFYYYDIPQWLNGDPGLPKPPEQRKEGRNNEWIHLNNADVISMPDKWEYPWYAAWDLAFHCLPLSMVDIEFAKQQLILFTREWYMHPNGQLPAYEWQFSDVNPPVHAWAAWRMFQIEKKQMGGDGDLAFLESIFHKMLLNFTWWVNRKDVDNHNIFQGGFLGLDNIGVFDRSKDLPTGGHLEQADGTSWMAMFSLNLMRMALELAKKNPVYQDMATKFFEHFLYIANAMVNIGKNGESLWDDEDEFFYDALHTPDGSATKLRIRSLVGLIPLLAVEVLEPELMEQVPEFARRLDWFLNYRPDLASLVSHWNEPGKGNTRLLSLLRGHRMKRLLSRMLDASEFLSPFGIRSVSQFHKDNPYDFYVNNDKLSVSYLPAESDSGLFGGNSNWRGPIWFPINYLLIESLYKFHHYYGDGFEVEYPTTSGKKTNLKNIADSLAQRLNNIFLKDKNGARPFLGNVDKFQKDPNFQNHILFHEYFHGDNGKGLGASHQTGWSGLSACLLDKNFTASSLK